MKGGVELSAIIIGCGVIIAVIIGYEKLHHKRHCDNDFFMYWR